MSNPDAVLVDHRRSRRHIHIGRVTVFRRGAAWCLYFRERGKPRRFRVGPERKLAEQKAAEINAHLAHGLPSAFEFQRTSVEELAGAWLEHHEFVARSSVATVKRYRVAVEYLLRFVRQTRPGMMADEVTPPVTEEFVKYLRRVEVAPNGHPNAAKRNLRDKGVVFILGVCRSLFSFAARQRRLPAYSRNPFGELGIERMRIEDAKPVAVLTAEEESRFLAACDDWQFGIFFTLAFTGMRPGELCHLRVEDLEASEGVLWIRNRRSLGWRTKSRHERRVPLFPELQTVLLQRRGGRSRGVLFLRRRFASGNERALLGDLSLPELERELARRLAAGREAQGAAWTRLAEEQATKQLWRDAGMLPEKKLRTEFIKVARRIGRRDLTCPKLWRHQMATAMQEADVDPFVRKEIIGHTRLETTGLYTHTQRGALERQMEKLLAVRKETLASVKGRLGQAPGSAAG